MQVLTCAITRDRKKVVSGSDDNTLKVWDMESGIKLLTPQGHTEEVIVSFCFFALHSHSNSLLHTGYDMPYHSRWEESCVRII